MPKISTARTLKSGHGAKDFAPMQFGAQILGRYCPYFAQVSPDAAAGAHLTDGGRGTDRGYFRARLHPSRWRRSNGMVVVRWLMTGSCHHSGFKHQPAQSRLRVRLDARFAKGDFTILKHGDGIGPVSCTFKIVCRQAGSPGWPPQTADQLASISALTGSSPVSGSSSSRTGGSCRMRAGNRQTLDHAAAKGPDGIAAPRPQIDRMQHRFDPRFRLLHVI